MFHVKHGARLVTLASSFMFGVTDYSAFCLAVLVFLALPGPGTFALLSSLAKGGARAALAATAGLIAGDQVLMWLAVAGVAALMKSYPALFQAVQYAGAAYLCWVGVRLLWQRNAAGHQADDPVRIAPRHYTRQAFFITLLNPKAIVFYMAFFPLFIDPASHQGLVTFAAMAATIAVLSVAYCVFLILLADRLMRQLRAHGTGARWLQRVAGLFLIGFGIRLGSQTL